MLEQALSQVKRTQSAGTSQGSPAQPVVDVPLVMLDGNPVAIEKFYELVSSAYEQMEKGRFNHEEFLFSLQDYLKDYAKLASNPQFADIILEALLCYRIALILRLELVDIRGCLVETLDTIPPCVGKEIWSWFERDKIAVITTCGDRMHDYIIGALEERLRRMLKKRENLRT